jgi:integrase
MARGGAFRPKGRNAWRARWDLSPDPVTGQRRQRSKGGFSTRKAAEAYASTQTAQVARGLSIDPGRTTLADYLKVWLQGLHADVRASTFDWYRGKITHAIVPALGAIKIRDLQREQIRAFYASLPPPMVDRVHRALRRALYEAVASGLIAANPAANMRRNASVKARGRGMRIWSWEQVRTFLEVSDQDRYAALWRLYVSTGCRRGEALGVFWSDVDLQNATVRLQRGLADRGPALEETKTPAARRTVDLDDQTVGALERWRFRQIEDRLARGASWPKTVALASGEQVEHELVFTRPTGCWIPPSKVGQAFHRLRQRAGLPHIRLHDLRHTHATLLLAGGMNAKVVAERLGHNSVSITLDLYGHVLPSMGREAAGIVSAMLGPGH